MISLNTSKLDNGYFTKLFSKILIGTSMNPLPKKWDGGMLYRYPENIKPYLQLIYDSFDEELVCENFTDKIPVFEVEKTNKILVAFSGGKDSLATAIHAKKLGYQPVLFHMDGINRSYRHEKVNSASLAHVLGFELVVVEVGMGGKCDYVENPTKNQFILANMVDYGVKHGITNFTFGNAKEDIVEEASLTCNLSDSLEMFTVLDLFYNESILGYECHTFLEDLTHAYYEIYWLDRGLLSLVSSCMGPKRYKHNFRKHNEEKYGIKLLAGRCGSCSKCATEYITTSLFEMEDVQLDYFQHCLNILKRKIMEEFPKYDGNMSNNAMLTKYVDLKYVRMINPKFEFGVATQETTDIIEYLEGFEGTRRL